MVKTWKSLLFLACLYFPVTAFPQVYTDVASQQGVQFTLQEAYNGSGLSFYDFTGDGWDDLVFCSRNAPLKFYKNINGTFLNIPAPVSVEGEVKSVVFADIDNDGDADMLVTRFGQTSCLYENLGDLIFEDISVSSGLPQNEEAQSYGASFADVNRDGWLDLYVCNYNWPSGITNWLLINNGDNTFTDVSAQTPANDGSRRSFQSCFLDINRDLWPDLFVANDKYTRTSLYSNSAGTFTDVSEASGAALYMETMCVSAADFDHDLDLDIYLSNNSQGNVLLGNEAASFSNIAPSAGVACHTFCWGSLWVDPDNDGWEDLYVLDTWPVGEDANRIYHNNSNGTFSLIPAFQPLNDFNSSYSNASGDVNNDGFPDVACVNEFPEPANLWLNAGNESHWLKIKLEGVQSNRDGIGSWIDVWTNGEVQSRYTMCGENYLGQNSRTEFFGMGEHTQADSIVVSWPSGVTDRLYNVQSLQLIHLVEGSSVSAPVPVDQTIVMCGNEISTWDFSMAGVSSWMWNDGVEDPVRVFSESGSYSFICTWNSIQFNSGVIEVSIGLMPEFEEMVQHPSCSDLADGMIGFSFSGDPGVWEVYWSDGVTGPVRTGLSGGQYSWLMMDSVGCELQGQTELVAPDPLLITVSTIDVSCYGGSDGFVDWMIEGGTSPVVVDWQGPDVDALPAGTYELPVADANGCGSVIAFSIGEPSLLEGQANCQYDSGIPQLISLEAWGGIAPYTCSWSNGSEEWFISDPQPGTYTWTIVDANGCSTEGQLDVIVDGIMTVNVPVVQIPDVLTAEREVLIPCPAGLQLIRVVDLHGREVGVAQQRASGGIRIDLASLAVGTYVLRWEQNDHTYPVSRLLLVR